MNTLPTDKFLITITIFSTPCRDQLTGKMAIDELFSNITWTTGQAENIDDEVILSHWVHPLTNIYVTMTLFIIMNVSNSVIC